MNMTQEMLEILIGKYLDGEITPSEQCILQTELERDIKAKELLGARGEAPGGALAEAVSAVEKMMSVVEPE